MVIALIGPSCSGKSFYLQLLNRCMSFVVPTGITTRAPRMKDNGVLRHVTEQEFGELSAAKRLCFVDEVFGHQYAYAYPLSTADANVGIEIRRNNIAELRMMGGVLLKVIPDSLELGLERIRAGRAEPAAIRIQELESEFRLIDEPGFDGIFRNRFDPESADRFLDLVRSFTFKGGDLRPVG